ncbi:MAG TPA: MMPL family transporter [Solirubrobacterales bacterium]|nr:MMPL family transporter [Solirubrobacterales bacterium]
MSRKGVMARLGRWTATHFRLVLIVWVAIALVLGFFAPKVEKALSGAGWEATGSESLEVREMVDEQFGGMSSSALMVVIHSEEDTATDPEFTGKITRAAGILRSSDDVSSVITPRSGGWISPDGHTVVVQGGAAADSNQMVRAADDLKGPLSELDGDGFEVSLTGASGMWSDFNHANKEAMLKSELISWPVTLAILVLAFGSLVAAGLPLMLTIVGLVAAAGTLYLGTSIADISIWAMNFALMFALALGIDYALFIVYRFRGALGGSGSPVDAVETSMETAGKAVLFSGLTVLISLSAVLQVPSPAFRSMAIGIMLAVIFVLAASLTLLPAVLGRIGQGINRLSLPWVRPGETRSARFAAWAERLWKRPLAYGIPATLVLLALAVPILALDTGMPSIKVVPAGDQSRTGYERLAEGFGPGSPGSVQVITKAPESGGVVRTLERDPGIVRVMPPVTGTGDTRMIQAVPASDPSSAEMSETVERLRENLAGRALLGGASVENFDLERALADKTAPVIGVVLALGFLLLLLVLRAPVVAALGVLTNLLAAGAAFGVAKLLFQDGHLSGILGFESQGFLDAWAPVFFFAMVFAISMDYSVFLLSSAKEHWERTGDPRQAMIEGTAHSGRVIFAAAGVMVAVFFTFALSGPLPPKEMGIILGVAVLLDAALVRLLLLPVLIRLAGRWAWWLPGWADRILPKISFRH